MIHTLPALPYAYDALQPVIDAQTMTIHHTKHHQTYIDKLNAGLAGTPYADWSLDDLMSKLQEIPESLRPVVRNHGGGHRNHTFFWESMTPGGIVMSDVVQSAIDRSFGSVEQCQQAFATAAAGVFGSGWARLVVNTDGMLAIMTTPNQDNPLMQGKQAILGLDVREHAYYLQYQNRRADYIAQRWSIVNWTVVERRMQLV